MDWTALLNNLIAQGPMAAVLGFMWWREASRADNLQNKLLEIQANTIQTFENVKGTLEIIKAQVSK